MKERENEEMMKPAQAPVTFSILNMVIFYYVFDKFLHLFVIENVMLDWKKLFVN